MKEYPFCPVCGADDSVKRIKKIETINIRGTDIDVETEVYECDKCGESFASLSETFDFINQARQQYRIMFNIPSPEEIREFMNKYNFSLRDMEKLTGIAFKTIDRYLKGAIPDPSNAKFLKLLLNNPETVLFLMNEDEHFKSPKFAATRELLEKEIKEKHQKDCPICKIELESTIQSWIDKTNTLNVYTVSNTATVIIDILEKVNFSVEWNRQKKTKAPLFSLNLANLLFVGKIKNVSIEKEKEEDLYSYAG